MKFQCANNYAYFSSTGFRHLVLKHKAPYQEDGWKEGIGDSLNA